MKHFQKSLQKYNRNRIVFILAVIVAAFTLFSCAKTPAKVKLVFIETTDVHGSLFPYDFVNEKKISNSLVHVNNYVNKLRSDERNHVILMDNGDILQGQPTVYFSNYVDTVEKHIVPKVLNYMKYDVATVGNHDIEAGHSVYDKLIDEFNFPWLAANAVYIESGKPYFQPYTILNKDGVKIAVLGLVTAAIPKWLPETLYSGIRFESMHESAKKWVDLINEKENPDVLIGLFHSGMGDGINGDEENESLKVVKEIQGFDVVFIGHDHRIWNEKVVNNYNDTVYILGSGSNAKNIAQATIQLEKSSGKYSKSIHTDIIDAARLELDQEMEAFFEHDMIKIKHYVNDTIGFIHSDLFAKEALFGSSPFMNLIHDVQIESTEADVSFAAPFSSKALITKGYLKMNDLFKLYRYENLLYTMHLTGNEIDKYLEYSYGNWFSGVSESKYLLKYNTNKNKELIPSNYTPFELTGRIYNFDSAYGINYNVDLSKPKSDRVEITSFQNGNTFYSDSIYLVAINSYRANGGGGHLTEGVELTKSDIVKRTVFTSDRDMKYFIEKYIREKGEIIPNNNTNWKLIPVNEVQLKFENEKELWEN